MPLKPDPDEKGNPKDTPVTITVRNIKLDQVGLGDVKVALGSQEFPANTVAKLDAVKNPATYTVTFTAPAAKPDANTTKYLPILILQGKTRVPGKESVPGKVGHEFVYP